jgi:hypothetical protein
MEKQTAYHFFASSILFIYEGYEVVTVARPQLQLLQLLEGPIFYLYHCPGAPTGPISWCLANVDSLYTAGTLLTPLQAALHVRLQESCSSAAQRVL